MCPDQPQTVILLSTDVSVICPTCGARHLPASVVGYGMGHASSGDFAVPFVWWVAVLSVGLSVAALVARVL